MIGAEPVPSYTKSGFVPQTKGQARRRMKELCDLNEEIYPMIGDYIHLFNMYALEFVMLKAEWNISPKKMLSEIEIGKKMEARLQIYPYLT